MATREHKKKGSTDVAVPMEDVVRFVRQLSHDLRNHLNAAELQAAFMNEIAGDSEVKEEITRLRGVLGEMGHGLQRLSASLTPPRLTLMPYEAKSFVEDLQQKVALQFPEQKGAIEWKIAADGATLEIDPQVLQQAVLELFANAFLHERGVGGMTAAAETRGGEFHFTLREPKAAFNGSTEQWGCEPFRHVKHGHYGIGLHRTRQIVEAHRGRLEAQFDSTTSALATRIILPVVVAR
ncbi:hypothetical protein BH20VER1_BH20VER1_10880 [soil metagenome]